MEKHYTSKELAVKSQREIIDEVISMGAPVRIIHEKNFDTSDYVDGELEFGEGFESHSDINGGVTYIWDFWE
jgi:hypothetical protein